MEGFNRKLIQNEQSIDLVLCFVFHIQLVVSKVISITYDRRNGIARHATQIIDCVTLLVSTNWTSSGTYRYYTCEIIIERECRKFCHKTSD